jgi:hypothetical protein
VGLTARKLPRRYIGIAVILILIAVFGAEVYAHNYVQVATLPVVTADYALTHLRAMNIAINDTHIFSSNGATWLLVLSLYRIPNPGYVLLYIFKIQENKTFFTQSVDLVGVSLDVKSGPTNIVIPFSSTMSFGLNDGNSSIVLGQYQVDSIGTYYYFDFAFTFMAYEKTLVGILSSGEMTVVFTENMTIPE